ncbi:hypothetical protein STXM2123_2642 [Streptomyces sp. F-3]|nr:hypothetical protein STXM2123_2642 [Streptomyces sp. F-3]
MLLPEGWGRDGASGAVEQRLLTRRQEGGRARPHPDRRMGIPPNVSEPTAREPRNTW